MTEAQREVWVRENANQRPMKVALTPRGAASSAREAQVYGLKVVRYVPESEAAGPAWVDCSVRMPAPYDVVQFLTHGGDVCVGPRRPPFGHGDDAWWEDMTDVDAACECSRYDDEQVTHWAPLLKPPSKPEGPNRG